MKLLAEDTGFDFPEWYGNNRGDGFGDGDGDGSGDGDEDYEDYSMFDNGGRGNSDLQGYRSRSDLLDT